MKLSVIIPYYNADSWIGRMLDSLLKQDIGKDEYEIIVVDDGSKEEPVILKKYVQQFPNIIYLRRENSGPGAARNTGIEMAKGEYIFFCDSDDYIPENVLGGLYSIAHEQHLDMLFHQIRRIAIDEVVNNPKRNFDKVDIFTTAQDFFGLPVKHKITTGVWQFFISRDFIVRSQLAFPENRIMNEDSSFLIDAVLVAGKTGRVDVDAYYYVQNPQSLIHLSGRVNQAVRWTNNMLEFVKKLTNILQDENVDKNIQQGCLKNIKWVRNQKAFIMLIGACHNLSPTSFKSVVLELQHLRAFPKPFGRYWILKYLFLRPSFLKVLNRLYASKKKNSEI